MRGCSRTPAREHREDCVSILSSLLSPHSLPQPLTAGRSHLQPYLNHLPSRIFRWCSALSKARYFPLGPGTFTHNTAGVPIIVMCSKANPIDDNPDLVGAGASGIGEGEERRKWGAHIRDHPNTAFNLFKVGVDVNYKLPPSYSHGVGSCRLCERLSCDTETDDTILNVLRRGHYPLHILFVSHPASDDALEDAADRDISPWDPSQSPMPTKDTQDSILLVGTPIPLMAGTPPDDLPTETFCLTLG